jgi:chromosome partitioning protein
MKVIEAGCWSITGGRIQVRIWSIANQKGGVGKTTTVVSLGGLLAAQGQRVLLLDLDPHGSLTSYFRFDHDALPKSSFDIFQMSAPLGKRDVEALVVPTNQPNLSLIPATTGLATVERLLQGQDGLGLKISRALAQLWDDYDYAIIDTPPVLGVLMINALAACEKLLIPVQTEHLAIKGLERMLRTLAMINRSRKSELPYVIVPTMFDRRTHASTASLRILRTEHADHVWPAVVPVDTRFRDASKTGQVPSTFDPKARGVAAYDGLLRFLLRPANQAMSA